MYVLDSEDIGNDHILVLGGPEQQTQNDTCEDKEFDYQTYRIRRMHRLLQNKWPFRSSILQLFFGAVLVILGSH